MFIYFWAVFNSSEDYGQEKHQNLMEQVESDVEEGKENDAHLLRSERVLAQGVSHLGVGQNVNYDDALFNVFINWVQFGIKYPSFVKNTKTKLVILTRTCRYF